MRSPRFHAIEGMEAMEAMEAETVDVRTVNMQTQACLGKQEERQVVDKIDFSDMSTDYEQMKVRLKEIHTSLADITLSLGMVIQSMKY